MELKVVTLDRPRSLGWNDRRTREERSRKKDLRAVRLLGCVAGICIGIVIGIVIGSAAATLAAGDVTPPPEPKQMAGKVDFPAIATVSLLDTVEISQPDQVSRQWDVPLTDEEMAALLDACEAGHIDPTIGLGLIQVESNFRADALNPRSGCYGYCQLNPRYFPSDLSPADNIRTGIEFLAYQLERYDNLEAALTAYNAGYDTGSRTYADMVLEAAASFWG